MKNQQILPSLLLCIVLLSCLKWSTCLQAVYSVSPANEDAIIEDDGVEIYESREVELKVIGEGLYPEQKVLFTKAEGLYGTLCSDTSNEKFSLKNVEVINSISDVKSARITVSLLKNLSDRKWYYLCLQKTENTTITVNGSKSDVTQWIHQGGSVKIHAKSRLMPLWLQIVLICILFCVSGLFSGLTLGLMSLDPTELIIVQKSGTPSEKKYAKTIAPLRKRGNFLLCSLIIGNVLVNSTLTVLLDDVGGGLIALVCSTVGIVIFGEILPQAICSRYGLAIGARTRIITKLFMVLTFPISFPLSKILDKLLGEELGNVYNRERLAEMIRLGADKDDIKKEELNIIQGALQLTQKTARDVMTPIDDVYMVDYNAVLDFETMSDILHNGYSRIPVYEDRRLNIVALLNIKDLAFIDADDKLPLKTVCKFYKHHITFVRDDTPLDKLLEDFKKGHSHLAFVHKPITETAEAEPEGLIEQPPPESTEISGIVTLEDIIEEIIQSEILDESDIVTDNQTRRRRLNFRRDFSVFNTTIDNEGFHQQIPPQLALACYQFLQTSVEPFKEEYISQTILKRVLKQNIYIIHKPAVESVVHTLYQRGEPADYFIIILQGKCQVVVGSFNMSFEAGPFFTFGSEALLSEVYRYKLSESSNHLEKDTTITSNPFIPDFTATTAEEVEYVKVSKRHYLAARRATLLEQKQAGRPTEDDETSRPRLDLFQQEWTRSNDASSDNGVVGSPFSPHPPNLQRSDNVTIDMDTDTHPTTNSAAEKNMHASANENAEDDTSDTESSKLIENQSSNYKTD